MREPHARNATSISKITTAAFNFGFSVRKLFVQNENALSTLRRKAAIDNIVE